MNGRGGPYAQRMFECTYPRSDVSKCFSMTPNEKLYLIFISAGTWTYTKQVVDNMRKFCYQKQKTSMNWVVDLKSNVTELAETINEVSGQLRRVKRRVDKKAPGL